MSKTLQKIQNYRYVYAVDDERKDGNSIIITLKNGWFFVDEPDCGVRGFDTVADALYDLRKANVFQKVIVLGRT